MASLRDRLSDIAISTIDAFCLSLLREFPLEADLDPGFAVADETEVARLVEDALDRALRICRAQARDDADMALVFARLRRRRACAPAWRTCSSGASWRCLRSSRFRRSRAGALSGDGLVPSALGRVARALAETPGGLAAIARRRAAGPAAIRAAGA